MLSEDVPIWNLFLDRYAELFETIYYDVRVGGIVSTDPSVDDKMREAYWAVSAKRIDALCALSNELWIVEVASRPGLRAVGQLLTYTALWAEDPKIDKPTVGVLVAMNIDTDLQHTLEIYGMRTRLAG
jgi:hypothetical protein